jgi:hypothetical protein
MKWEVMKWEVQEVNRNTFKTNFQSRAKLDRMVEWGVVQTKDRMAKMIIEENAGGSDYKQALHGVWVQMTGLPGELQEYLTIWAIGMILSVTKVVDMTFTREFERTRFQILVLDPSLILHSVDVVIGEFIYELHFWVKHEEMAQPVPIDMEDDSMEDKEEERDSSAGDPKPLQQDPHVQKCGTGSSSAAGSDAGIKKTHYGKSVLYHILVIEMLQDHDHEVEKDKYVVAVAGDAPGSNPPSPIMHEVEMAAIPESETPGRNKRRTESVDESSLERVEHMKAARNLDL